jgi:hypothetical protein
MHKEGTMATSTETALQAKASTPNLTSDDLQRSITFYEGLGFGVEERWEDNGVLLGVMMIAGQARIGLSQDDWKKGRERLKGVGMRIFLGTDQEIDLASISTPSRTTRPGAPERSTSPTRTVSR